MWGEGVVGWDSNNVDDRAAKVYERRGHGKGPIEMIRQLRHIL